MSIRRAVVAVAIVSGLLGLGAGPADAELELRGARPHHPLTNERLSNERTLTRIARPVLRARIRRAPRHHAGTITRLHFLTEDRRLESYLLLRVKVDRHGHRWIKLRVPGRPNGRTGWVPRFTLGHFIVRRTQLRIDRYPPHAVLLRKGKPIWRSPVGTGKRQTPTPAGRFWIRERLKGLGGLYGPWAFGTAAYSVLSEWPGGGVIGIHGTSQPWLIPGHPSHGCVRVPNRKISRLVKLMPIGTPVRIL